MDLSAGEGRVYGRALGVVVAACVELVAFSGRADAPAKTFPPLPTSMTVAELPGWLRANTDIPPAALVALVQGVGTIMADPGTAAASGRRTNVVVRREALSDRATEVIGGRSELVHLELDCNASQYRLTARSVYVGNSLSGPAHVTIPNTTMADVPPNTDLAFLLRAVCNPAYQPPLAPYLASAPAAPAVAAQPVAQPTATLARPPALVAQQQPPQPPAPTARPAPVAATQTARASAADRPPVAPTGKFVAQVSASASEALAHKLLSDLTRRVPEVAGMRTSVDRVRVKDAILFRVSVDGFQTSSTAEAFCVRLRSASFPCWVR